MNIEKFVREHINNRIYIYGAGNLGNLLFWFLQYLNIHAEKYIVSEYSPDGYYVTNGLPIESKREFLNHYEEDATVIVAIKFQEKLVDELKGEGIQNVYCLNSADEVLIAKSLFDKMIPGVRIKNTSEKLIDICGQKLVNPFKDDERFLDFFMGGVDMLFPWLCNENRWINEGPYELDKVVMKAGDIVINCGASVGLFSQVALNRGCEVYAFEPAKKQLRELENALKNFDATKWKIVNKALSDCTGEHRFYIHKSFEYDGFYEKGECIGETVVPTITLDDYVAQNNLPRIDFIKANIEGAERLMLLGAQRILKEMEPCLSIRANHLTDDVDVISGIIKSINSRYHIIHKYKTIYAYTDK